MILRYCLYIVLAMASHMHLLAEYEYEIPSEEYQTQVKEFVCSFNKQVEKELSLKLNISETWHSDPFKEGAYFHDPFKCGMWFHAFRPATLEEARALALAVIDKLAAALQANQNLSPCYKEQLSAPGLFRVSISFEESGCSPYENGSVSTVRTISDQKIRYCAESSSYKFNDEPNGLVFEESYADAVQLNQMADINPAIHELMSFENELNKVLTVFENKMRKEKNLSFKFNGSMVFGKKVYDVSELRGTFQYQHQPSLKAARLLMLNTIEQLLDAINSSEALRPYLAEYPFPSSRLKLSMLFRWTHPGSLLGSSYNAKYENGGLDSIEFDKDILTYFNYQEIWDVLWEKLKYKKAVFTKETFPEAKKAILDMPYSSTEKISETAYGWVSSSLDWISDVIAWIFRFAFFNGGVLLVLLIPLICIVCVMCSGGKK